MNRAEGRGLKGSWAGSGASSAVSDHNPVGPTDNRLICASFGPSCAVNIPFKMLVFNFPKAMFEVRDLSAGACKNGSFKER